MFGHLDHPAGVSPGAHERANIVQRAHAIRLRRRVFTVAACLVIVAGVAGYFAARSSSGHISATETGYQFNALRGPLAIGTPVPATALVNVVFVDAQEGYALAAHRGDAVMATTADGGESWQVHNSSLPAGYGQNDGYSGQFEFEGSNGYLWGGAPEADGAAPLWVTSDGGISWHAAPIGPVVYDVSAIGANVWALTSSCSAKPILGAAASPCPLTLEQSFDAGVSWHAPGSTGFMEVSRAPPLAQRVELARITLSRSYVLTMSAPGQSGIMELVFTDDGGATWQTRPVPCGGAVDLGAEIAASSTEDLWLLCGSQASAGEQSKQLYRSEDGGIDWALAASAAGLGTTPPVSHPNSLPLDGYIAPFSVGHKNLAVASSTTAWLYPVRAVIYKTVNGGQSWSAVPGLNAEGFGSGAPGNVTFISATQGWICEEGVGLWHTNDGVHWSPLGV